MGKPATPNAPQDATPQSLGALAAAEVIRKSARVFADMVGTPRVTLSDGRIGAVQREQRADGTEGPLMVAIIRPTTDGTESATRFPLADLQRFSDALGSHGVTLVAPYQAPAEAPAE